MKHSSLPGFDEQNQGLCYEIKVSSIHQHSITLYDLQLYADMVAVILTLNEYLIVPLTLKHVSISGKDKVPRLSALRDALGSDTVCIGQMYIGRHIRYTAWVV